MKVRLTEQGVRAYLSDSGVGPRRRQDWAHRTGRLIKLSRNQQFAYVVWDGNSSMDQVSMRVLMIVEPEAEDSAHPFTLHLWRDTRKAMRLPPSIMVGIKEDGTYANAEEARAGLLRAKAKGLIK